MFCFPIFIFHNQDNVWSNDVLTTSLWIGCTLHNVMHVLLSPIIYFLTKSKPFSIQKKNMSEIIHIMKMASDDELID